jgi:hypothetical protein
MAAHVHKHLTPDSVFAAVIAVSVQQTNLLCVDRLDNGTSPVTDSNESKMFLFLVIISQTEHGIWNSLQDYWIVIEDSLTLFYGKTVTATGSSTFFDISTFPSITLPQTVAPSYDKLWKLGHNSDKLNDFYSKYYITTKHLSLDEVLSKGRVNFKQNILKKYQHFGTIIYK